MANMSFKIDGKFGGHKTKQKQQGQTYTFDKIAMTLENKTKM